MAQQQIGFITTNTNTTTTNNPTQYEEVEYPQRDTITIQPTGPVTIDHYSHTWTISTYLTR